MFTVTKSVEVKYPLINMNGEVENTTNTETEVTENSGVGGLGIAIAGLAILGTVAVGKAVYTGGKKLIGKVKANIDKKKESVEQGEETDVFLEEYDDETENEEA